MNEAEGLRQRRPLRPQVITEDGPAQEAKEGRWEARPARGCGPRAVRRRRPPGVPLGARCCSDGARAAPCVPGGGVCWSVSPSICLRIGAV